MFPVNDIHIHVVRIGPDYFSIIWDLPGYNLELLPCLHYYIQSNDCGKCIQSAATTNFVSCSNYHASVQGHECIMNIFAEPCNRIHFNNSVSLKLRGKIAVIIVLYYGAIKFAMCS